MQPVTTSNIPAELRERKQWVLWKFIGDDKRKCLFQTNGQTAKTNDPSTWDTFDNCFAMGMNSKGWEGLGYVFSADDPFCGIDLDGCRSLGDEFTKPQTEQWAVDIIKSLGGYAELSPSLTGVKIFVRATWGETGRKMPLPEMPKVCPKEPGIEVYDRLRFFTVTGIVVGGQRTIGPDSQLPVEAIRERFFQQQPTQQRQSSDWRSSDKVYERARAYIAKMSPAVSGQDGHGATFKVACALVLGFNLSQDDALSLLREYNATCQPPWSERDLVHKVKSADQQSGERGYLRNALPENYHHVEKTTPNYREPDATEPDPEVSPVTVTTMDQAATKYLETLEAGGAKLIELGLPDLDYGIGGGVEPGEMIIFAARPSHGKSMAAQQIVHNKTLEGVPCVFVSEEMGHLAIGKRTIQFATEVHNEHWTHESNRVRSDMTRHFSKRAPCYILEGCRTIERVSEQITKYVREFHCGLAVVDYAQLLGAKGKGRYEQITAVSMGLKKLATECQIPIIVLCQMSRSIEGRPDFIPTMSDLKETGQFEQDADVIISQVWPHRLDPRRDASEYLMFINKNRNRPINQNPVKCHFEPGRQRLVTATGTDTTDELAAFSDDVLNAFDGDFR